MSDQQLTARELKAKRDQYVAPTAKYYYADPPHFVRGEMQSLFDDTGRRYLDLFGGICTVSVGHCNPFVTDAVVEQARKLQHVSTVFLSQPLVDLAEKLAQITPGALSRTFVTNSGTEANETALLLAKTFTGRSEVLALRHSYHGRSWLAASLTSHAAYRVDPMPVPGISFVPNAYCYRCPLGKEYPSCELACAKAVEDVIQTQTTGAPAVMIAEPIQGVGGIVTPPPEYFTEVKTILDKYGVLLVADEVQTGFGRTGESYWGISGYGVQPDLMTMAKSIANGFPAGACVARPDIAETLQRGTINTFGGNPVSSTAALATIEYIEREGLMERARDVGGYLISRLKELESVYTSIGEVRGKGLMIGVELVKDRKTREPAPELATQIMELAKDAGLIIGKGGIHNNTLRIQPPMIITRSDIDEAIGILEKCFDKVSGAVAV